jgi:hypothetical protein
MDRSTARVSATLPEIRRPAYQAFRILQFGFVVLPIIAGVDKFFDLLVDWHTYVAPVFVRLTGMEPHRLLYGAGIVEIVAGIVVALRPRFGGYLVASWLAAIIINLLLVPGFYDIAARDFGLLLGALALARLAEDFEG